MLPKNNFYFIFSVILIAIISGLAGIVFHHFFIFIGLLIYHSHSIIGLAYISPVHLFTIVFLTGLLAAIIWFFLQYKTPIVSIKQQMNPTNSYQYAPPFIKHISHVFLQIASVSLGSPIGKETGPREFGSLIAGRLSTVFHLDNKNRKLLLASGAASGLAAIYQVPFAGTFFAFESLKLPWTLKNIVVVFCTSEIANHIVKLNSPEGALYALPNIKLSLENVTLMLLIVLCLTPLAILLKKTIAISQQNAYKDFKILYALPLTFLLLAGMALVFPEILGNGEALAKTVIQDQPIGKLFVLVLAKIIVVSVVLKAGGYGGTLTPSFSIGLGAGSIFYMLISVLFPISKSVSLILGAQIFLMTTMSAPLSALSLVSHFTGQSSSSILLMLLTLLFVKFYTYILSLMIRKS